MKKLPLLLLQEALTKLSESQVQKRGLAGKKDSSREGGTGDGLEGTKIHYMYVCKE